MSNKWVNLFSLFFFKCQTFIGYFNRFLSSQLRSYQLGINRTTTVKRSPENITDKSSTDHWWQFEYRALQLTVLFNGIRSDSIPCLRAPLRALESRSQCARLPIHDVWSISRLWRFQKVHDEAHQPVIRLYRLLYTSSYLHPRFSIEMDVSVSRHKLRYWVKELLQKLVRWPGQR